jgi:amidase
MSDRNPDPGGLGRRDLLRLGATAAIAPLAGAALGAQSAERERERGRGGAPFPELEEVTIAELQGAMAHGRVSARTLTRMYLARIDALDRHGPTLNSVIEINPDAEDIAKQRDAERRAGRVRGPLHGIPILLKDNIDTGDRMQTTAGSLALVGAPALQDSTVAALLRQAGAVILGKTNLSEWANFRSFHSSSGWSGRGGQCLNPYVLDRNPCGSSSGSGIAPAANLCAAALGSETDGSIVCPASINGVVGIKPTVGLTSRAGVVPISHSQDTIGPHGRTVADAAVVLNAIVSRTPDPRDPATHVSRDLIPPDYSAFINPNGLRGARIGVARAGVTGYSEETDRVYEEAIAAIRAAGAVVIDPADIPTIDEISQSNAEIVVLVHEFKRDLNAYLATRTGVPVRTMADVIRFNLDHADRELKWFLQEWFDLSESDPFDEATYLAALAEGRRLGGADGIDALLAMHRLDAIIAPTGQPTWPIDLVNGDHFLGASSSPAAIAGYPLISVPAGAAFGLPVGLTFMGTAFSEPTLIKLASGFEAATHARTKPRFMPTLPLDQGRRRGGHRRTLTLPSGKRPVICQL